MMISAPDIPEHTTPEVEAAKTALRRARHCDARKARRLQRELIMVKAKSLKDRTTYTVSRDVKFSEGQTNA